MRRWCSVAGAKLVGWSLVGGWWACRGTLRSAILAGVALLCTLTLTACRSGTDRLADDISRAQERGLAVYWLGEAITHDGKTLANAESGDLFNDSEGSFEVAYADATDDDELEANLSVRTYALDEWAQQRSTVLDPINAPSPVIREIDLVATPATMVIQPLGSRTRNSVSLILSFNDGVVVARTNSVHDSDGTEMNPLIDEATFLAVMEQLRPYPE